MKPRGRSVWQRLGRWSLALLLVPCVLGTLRALARLVVANGSEMQIWVPVVSGAAAWVVLFLSLPRPLWLYVVGHELTHVLWGWLFGARVRSFRATSRGGMVRISKSNSLIALSPYFFPLYAILWMLLFPVAARLAGLEDPTPWYLLGLGACYAFHFTLTFHVLHVRQPDLDGEGWVFSAVLIALGNALMALIGMGRLTPRPGLLTALGWAFQDTLGVVQSMVRWLLE